MPSVSSLLVSPISSVIIPQFCLQFVPPLNLSSCDTLTFLHIVLTFIQTLGTGAGSVSLPMMSWGGGAWWGGRGDWTSTPVCICRVLITLTMDNTAPRFDFLRQFLSNDCEQNQNSNINLLMRPLITLMTIYL